LALHGISFHANAPVAAQRQCSLIDMHLPDFAPEAPAAHADDGHDGFAVCGSALDRRFPTFRHGSSRARPTGGVRQLHHKLAPCEAGWLLSLDRASSL
jgi:hypothetical protein